MDELTMAQGFRSTHWLSIEKQLNCLAKWGRLEADINFYDEFHESEFCAGAIFYADSDHDESDSMIIGFSGRLSADEVAEFQVAFFGRDEDERGHTQIMTVREAVFLLVFYIGREARCKMIRQRS